MSYKQKYLTNVFLSPLILLGLITACTDTNVKPSITVNAPITFTIHDLFGEKPEIITEDDIYKLSVSQQEDFLTYFNHPSKQDTPPHERIYYYLEQSTLDFNYHSKTNIAEKAMRLSEGNCLSLANLTTALARIVNVKVGYQLVDDIPVFEQQKHIILKGMHVRSMLYKTLQQEKKGRSLTHGRSGIKVDYFPSGTERFIKNISESEFIAMYYRNKAAEAIAIEDYSNAYWLLLTSMEHAPDNAEAINMMAVIHRRVGDEIRAEQIYQYGIEYSDNKLSLLKNYQILLNEQGRFEEAQQVSNTLNRLDDPSPFNWLYIANEAFDNKNFSEAVIFYRKVTKLAPYLHEGHFGMAKSYYQLGRINAAERNMRLAMENAFKRTTKSLYHSKLMMLSKAK